MTTKKFLSMAALALVGAMMTGCSGDDDGIAETPQQPGNKGNVVTLTTTVGLEDGGAQTRALTGGGVKTFAEGETMAVVYNNGATTVKAVSHPLGVDDIAVGAKSATFTFDLESPDTSEDVTYIYPAAMANSDGSINYDALATQDGTLATLSSSLDLATKSAAWAGTSLPGATLENQLAILACTLKNNDGSSNITGTITGMTVSDGTNSYAITGHDSDGHIYVAIRPTAAAALEVTATDGYFNYTKTATSRDYAQGNGYSLSWRMEKQPTDLSMVDCTGKIQATMSTANCYMVHTAGDYKLPLVYGNAIKDGADNTAAYNPGEMTTSNPYCANFVNHADQAITAPWIKDNNITVTQAELLWQDAEGLITAVGIDGDYLTLTVGTDADTQEGNALVAAKTADGTIVWSWHIWVTKQTFAADDLTTITASDYGYKVTPVNLGWVGDATSGATGYCTFYQWGRKDAFIPSTGGGNTNHTVYNISNAPVSGISHTDDDNVTIGGNIQHPTVHYRNTSTSGPCNTGYYNMWDAQQTSDDNVTAATVKTVYDPCPPGFCVPTRGLYYYISSQAEPTFNKGYTYSGVFFPASGRRGGTSGDLDNVGTNGYCWSAAPIYGTYGGGFHFRSSGWYLNGSSRSYGYPVRAVAE